MLSLQKLKFSIDVWTSYAKFWKPMYSLTPRFHSGSMHGPLLSIQVNPACCAAAPPILCALLFA